MPNQLSFDIEFTRVQIQKLLDNSDATHIAVSGTYNYNPDLGLNFWEMSAFAEGSDDNKNIVGPKVFACIKPCPAIAP